MQPLTSASEGGHVPQATLRVETGSHSTEVLLLDSALRLVARGIGTLTTTQPPGVYKIRVEQGSGVEERPILLTGDATERFSAPAFASAAPLEGTSRSHEFHMGAAQDHSKKIDRSLGKGSSLFFLARYWTSPTPTRQNLGAEHPAKGLSIATFDGAQEVELEGLGAYDPGGDAWAAATVEVAPGAYILRARTQRQALLEQTLVASPDWQTQVFVLRGPIRQPGLEESRRASREARSELADVSILLSKGAFMSNDDGLRRTERAKVALVDERPVPIMELLDAKFENPMLGIYGAHLLLLARERAEVRARETSRRSQRQENYARPLRPDPEFDQALFDTVVRNLRRLLGTEHPDVEALSLQCGDVTLRTKTPFVVPPLLRRSWSILVEASNERPELVPREIWKRVAMITPSQPFFSWLGSTSDRERSAYLEELTSQLKKLDEPRQGALESLSSSSADVRKQVSIDLEIPRGALESLLGGP